MAVEGQPLAARAMAIHYADCARSVVVHTPRAFVNYDRLVCTVYALDTVHTGALLRQCGCCGARLALRVGIVHVQQE